jgi:hypothetical protein
MEAIALQSTFPFNPMKPTGQIARLLRAVKDDLPKELRELAGLFCAIGTGYDYLYGVDGFVALRKNLWHPATFDIATSQHSGKSEGELKAGWLITPNVLCCNENLARIGEEMADQLVTSYQQKKRWKHRRKRRTFADRTCVQQMYSH